MLTKLDYRRLNIATRAIETSRKVACCWRAIMTHIELISQQELLSLCCRVRWWMPQRPSAAVVTLEGREGINMSLTIRRSRNLLAEWSPCGPAHFMCSIGLVSDNTCSGTIRSFTWICEIDVTVKVYADYRGWALFDQCINRKGS